MTTKLKNLVLLLILLTLAGCSSIEKIEQPLISYFATLSNENTVGQSYVARYDGLDGFLIYVEPDPGAQGVVHLQLSEGPEENNEGFHSEILLCPFAAGDGRSRQSAVRDICR
jgi:hypothetical protein